MQNLIKESDNFYSSNPKHSKASYTTYDTSGPYTDPKIKIDVTKGLPKIKEKWALDRKDVEFADNFSSLFIILLFLISLTRSAIEDGVDILYFSLYGSNESIIGIPL